MHALKSLFLLGVVSLAGCASQPAVPPPEYPGLEVSDKIAIHDLRPKTESEKEIFSLLLTSDAYGIYRVPDAATKPTGMRLLAHRAYEAFPELGSQPTIEVEHFVTYANMQSRLRTSAVLAGLTGPIGVALMSKDLPASDVRTTQVDSALFEQTAGDEEYTRAYFTAEENPAKAPVNLIYIDTQMLGKRVASRCLVPPVAGKPNLYLVEALDMCIANHLALYRTKSADTAAK
ncbi:hypothetical protein JVX91_16630 [Pseudomonas sp. PDNC002]|uniref:hypothetical protein n=1 Tax=Pseudomonas sp. PDNC002 TaxID=2811422 RepID=UPI0019635DFB|nr:hypothetical protein [Pseudomonas sp. PDNC002]QRY77235.1 hypothetical protein JVX91_16630 [Pseudomonas sp. PDNC002]